MTGKIKFLWKLTFINLKYLNIIKTADMNFKNMDKMIKYTNERVPSVNLFYSTPSCYVKSLNDIGKTWPTKTDDFFPYSNDPHGCFKVFFFFFKYL